MVFRVHRLRLVALALLAGAAVAVAQDPPPDPFGDAVREQERVREAALQKSQSAPEFAAHHWRGTDLQVGYGNEENRPKGASELIPPPGAQDDVDWTLRIGVGLAFCAAAFFLVTLRAARRR